MNRRSFLTSAAAAPAALALGSLPAAPAALLPDVSGAASAVSIGRVKTPWKWWIGYGKDRFHESFDTREEAIEAARMDDCACIVEARAGMAWIDVFDPGRVSDLMEEANEEKYDPEDGGPVFESVTSDDWNDLSARLNAVAIQWAIDRNIDEKTHVWVFDGMRNQETIAIQGEPA